MLMRRLLVERRHWITERQYGEAWALSQLSPGIHIVAHCGLLAQRMRGPNGVAVAVAALMIPSAFLTALLTAGYDVVQDQPLLVAALAGVAPMTAALTIGNGLLFGRQAVRPSRAAIVDVAIGIVAFAVIFLNLASTITVIVAAGVLGALVLGRGRPTSREAGVE